MIYLVELGIAAGGRGPIGPAFEDPGHLAELDGTEAHRAGSPSVHHLFMARLPAAESRALVMGRRWFVERLAPCVLLHRAQPIAHLAEVTGEGFNGLPLFEKCGI